MAAAASGLRCHDVIDERSAAFFALGLSRVTRQPTALICTSGSAAGHYRPAVMEASAAGVPLLILTADRPVELHDCGANQTTDQTRLFDGHIRWFFDLAGLPSGSVGLRAAQRLGAQAVATCKSPRPGPVHLNFRFRKPLEGTPAGEWSSPTFFASHRSMSSAAADELVSAVERAERPLLAMGPSIVSPKRSDILAIDTLLENGLSVFADITSGFSAGPRLKRMLRGAEALLRTEAGRSAFRPDLVVQIGNAPVGAAWNRWLASTSATQIAVHPYSFADTASAAQAYMQASTSQALALLAMRTTSHSRWDTKLHAAHLQACNAVPHELEHQSALVDSFAAAPPGASVMLGNSLTVRLADLLIPSHQVNIVHQRGLSGIDGMIAGAAGVATASESPTLALVGDITFAHDVASLAVASSVAPPLVIVVLNDRGGRIFEQLPVAKQASDSVMRDHFLMPSRLNVQAAAKAFDVRCCGASSRAELRAALLSAFASPGCSVVEVDLPQDGAARALARLDSSLEAALA